MVPAWLGSCCETGEGIYGRAGELYESWRYYARDRAAEAGSPAAFDREMASRGFPSDRIPPLERDWIRWNVRLR